MPRRCAGTYLGEDSPVRVHAVCPSFVDTPLVKGKNGLDEYVAMAGGRLYTQPLIISRKSNAFLE